MKRLPRLAFLLITFLFYWRYPLLNIISTVSAQTPPTNTNVEVEAFPEVKFPCDSSNPVEFHSLRPYQAAHCGDAGKALYCSNELNFIESFNVEGKGDCKPRHTEGDFFCNPQMSVPEHDLYVELKESMFPIMGNTEQVTNSQGGVEEFSNQQKVNEYASWYLSGVNNRAEYGESDTHTAVNYSGPLQKLLPKVIQEAERIKTIEKATISSEWVDDETNETFSTPQNHDQIVVCADESILGIIGKTKPTPCYSGEKHRLSEWLKDLSVFNGLLNRIGIDAWNKRTPPLPWSDENGEPFENQREYQKAYKEWQGGFCFTVPLINLDLCLENPFVPNKWAELYQYIPLSSTADKKGAERILDVQFKPSKGTVISGESYDEYNQKNAPLYFAHTQEVKELSETLNKTYTPKDFESKKLPTTEKNICSAVNIRTNLGDNLFPGDRVEGDTKEMIIPKVKYDITQARCVEKMELKHIQTGRGTPDPSDDTDEWIEVWTIDCNAEVAIVVVTDVKTPNADEIFSTTVADSGSTFRKIYPKVGEGAPVTCIADIPTVTSVKYDASESQVPRGGSLEFKVDKNPEDGGGGSELTFPHIGSIYEYFLNGIQTALRPQGYGTKIVSGSLCNNVKCGELPTFPKASGSCSLESVSSRIGDIPQSLKDIVSAAAETYKVPPNLILGALYGEGVFNRSDKNGNFSKYEWTDENVLDWATCTPLPNCSGPETSIVSFNGVWDNLSERIEGDLKKLDPNKNIPDPCNLIDSIYAIANNLHGNAGGSASLYGKSCLNITFSSSIPSSCTWTDDQYATAIRVWEFGTAWGDTPNGLLTCATKLNSCFTGGSLEAQCDKDTGPEDYDNCDNSSAANSHMRCVFDVANGN